MQELVIDYKTVFGSDAGKRVLADIEEFGFYRKCPFCPGNPEETLLNVGMQNLVFRINRIRTAKSGEVIVSEF